MPTPPRRPSSALPGQLDWRVEQVVDALYDERADHRGFPTVFCRLCKWKLKRGPVRGPRSGREQVRAHILADHSDELREGVARLDGRIAAEDARWRERET
ncbi:MAG: hypothetical protein HY329_25035 [Chloroflexi bacterium]|nr:hypothetical protein [Chloroflexota bacterium]